MACSVRCGGEAQGETLPTSGAAAQGRDVPHKELKLWDERAWRASPHFLDIARCTATLYVCIFVYMHEQLVICLLSHYCQTQAMLRSK